MVPMLSGAFSRIVLPEIPPETLSYAREPLISRSPSIFAPEIFTLEPETESFAPPPSSLSTLSGKSLISYQIGRASCRERV